MIEPTENTEGILNVSKVEVIRAQNEYMVKNNEYMKATTERELIEKMTLATDLLDIVYDTELPPKFEVVDITSVGNNTVEEKYKAITSVPELQTVPIIPEWMTTQYPIQETFGEDTRKKAPWINDIHAWMKVLNYSNTLSAIQRNKVENEDILGTIASIAEELYSFTTESDRKAFVRTSKQFQDQEKFPETILRESGTEGVNSVRHVSLAEMKYILQTMKKAFAKKTY